MRPMKDNRANIKASLRVKYVGNKPTKVKLKGDEILEEVKAILNKYHPERAVLNIIWQDISDFFNL